MDGVCVCVGCVPIPPSAVMCTGHLSCSPGLQSTPGENMTPHGRYLSRGGNLLQRKGRRKAFIIIISAMMCFSRYGRPWRTGGFGPYFYLYKERVFPGLWGWEESCFVWAEAVHQEVSAPWWLEPSTASVGILMGDVRKGLLTIKGFNVQVLFSYFWTCTWPNFTNWVDVKQQNGPTAQCVTQWEINVHINYSPDTSLSCCFQSRSSKRETSQTCFKSLNVHFFMSTKLMQSADKGSVIKLIYGNCSETIHLKVRTYLWDEIDRFKMF